MKIFIALFACLCAVAANAADIDGTCSVSVVQACKSTSLDSPTVSCDSRYGGIGSVEKEFQAYINAQLTKSYEYLLTATYFNSYQRDRPGFYKLFRGLSDDGFAATIEHIKKLTSRGGVLNYRAKVLPNAGEFHTVEGDELSSLAHALENEKALATSAIHVHGSAVFKHGHEGHIHDPDISQYFEEEVVNKQAKNIRKLSGYTNDLFNLMNKNSDPSLAVHLFDQYLEK